MQWETVIGLEIHAQLATRSKLFSAASTDFGAEPNTQACEVDLAMPGILPVVNREVVRMAVKFGLAIGAKLNLCSRFDRKNYFYPDLPKGYQISQYETPIVGGASLRLELEEGRESVIRIHRAHLEEDAGKLVHDHFQDASGVDLNRAGVPLLEIVTEPDFRSAQEAVSFLKWLRELLIHIGISDGHMAEGSFRCDVNLSLRRLGEELMGERVEIKNLNSFRFIERAIQFEVARQRDELERGGTLVRETRLYDPERDETRAMRSKEEDHDYRYFPDPDLLPLNLDEAFVAECRLDLPELPWELRARFSSEHQLGDKDAAMLAADPSAAAYFEVVAKRCGDSKLAANWVIVELAARLNKAAIAIDKSPVSAEQLGALLARIVDGSISGKIAKIVLEAVWQGEGEVEEVITSRGLALISDSEQLEVLVRATLDQHAEQANRYRQADDKKRKKMLGFFVGAIMKASQGRANPAEVNRLLAQELSKEN